MVHLLDVSLLQIVFKIIFIPNNFLYIIINNMVQTGGRKKRSKTGRKASAKFLAAGNEWRQHVKKVMSQNVGKDFKTILQLAAKTYKKGRKSLKRFSDSSISIEIRNKKAGKKAGKTKKNTKRAKKRGTRKKSRKRSSGFFGL